jgi:hypothetical protein
MPTEEAKISYLIFDKVQDKDVRVQIYQAFFHIETVKRFIVELNEAVRALARHRSALNQAQGMGLGGGVAVRGYYAEMECAKVRVIGLLGIVIPAGHRFLKSLSRARKRDKQHDWGKLRSLTDIEDLYRRARNACEHLSERIFRGEYTELSHFSFSIRSELRFLDSTKGEVILDFSEQALGELVQMWETVVGMMESTEVRQEAEAVDFDMDMPWPPPNPVPAADR